MLRVVVLQVLMIIIIILRVLSGDPTGYGAATSRVFAIYENFPV